MKRRVRRTVPEKRKLFSSYLAAEVFFRDDRCCAIDGDQERVFVACILVHDGVGICVRDQKFHKGPPVGIRNVVVSY